ncbi:unnamed protein product [Closterium sp. NIES-65]|nr:unnamed protein product [Closterium sp. NIES-65]
MYITLYFIVTLLTDSPSAVRDLFLALDPTTLTVDLLEKHLLAAETSIVVVGASRGTPRTLLFEGCSPSPLLPLVAFAAAVDYLRAAEVGAASAPSGRRRSGRGRVGRGGGGGGGGGSGGGSGSGGGGVGGGGGGGSGGSGGGSGGGNGSGGGGSGGGQGGTSQRGGLGGGQRQQQQHPGMEAAALGARKSAALGAGESALSGSESTAAQHTLTLDSGASCCFFRDSITLTPLSESVAVSLADPSGGPVLARSCTVLPCPEVPSGSLSGHHLPLFSTNLVRNTVLQYQWVKTFTLGGQRVAICTCSRTGRHLATFTRRPGSSLYTPTTAPPQVAASALVSASPPTLACPSLPYLCRGAAARRSSLLLVPPTTSPLQTLHLDV